MCMCDANKYDGKLRCGSRRVTRKIGRHLRTGKGHVSSLKIACLQTQEGLQRVTVHVYYQGFTANYMLSPFNFDTVEFLVYN